jgi:uncharacterized damage-inducible protein DinB
MRDYLLKLFAHDQWANRKLLETLEAQPWVPPRSRQLCGHIFAAHQFMNKRLHSVPANFAEFDFFPDYSLDRCRALSEEYGTRWLEYLRVLPEPLTEQAVSFFAPDGAPRKTGVVDALTHLYTHSIHHRGQIAVDLRAAGMEPVATDYIIFCRETGQS